MKYKNSRKKLVEIAVEEMGEINRKFWEDKLLSTLPEKECPNFTGGNYSPSLDGLEEIEEMPVWTPLDQEKGCINELGKAINSLIRNQNAIISFLKKYDNKG